MSWGTIHKAIHSNITDGSEYTDNKLIIPNVEIAHAKCDYCGQEILAVWDEHNKNKWYPYLGNQAAIGKNYSYSEILKAMKKFNGLMPLDNWKYNPLVNIHARVHCKDWSIRCTEGSLKLLCNHCFYETYNRIQVELNDGQLCAISVAKSRGETIMSVMDELHLKGRILGKGAKY